MKFVPRSLRSRQFLRVSGATTLVGEAERVSRRRWIEFRAAVGAFLLCAGLTILPALVALDVAVWAGCRGLGRGACLALIASAVTEPEMAQAGAVGRASSRSPGATW